MRKTITMLTLAGLLFSATTVLANEGHKGQGGEVSAQAKLKAQARFGELFKLKHHNDDERNHFALGGTVSAVGATSFTVTVNRGAPKDLLAKGSTVTVVVDADTKFSLNGRTEIALADLRVGNNVVVKGDIQTNNTLEANRVMVIIKPEKAYGSVTAKTDTSVTIKNSVTGVEKTVTVNPDTKVQINGEAATVADIQVGDKGVVKFKAILDGLVAKVIRLFR